jgi:gas vesicle protein
MGTKGTGKKIVGAAFLGALAGAVAGILLAPKKGEETRKDLKELSEKIKKQVAKKVAQVKKLTKKDYEKIINRVVAQYEVAKKFSQEDMKEIIDDIKNRWKEVDKKLKKKK